MSVNKVILLGNVRKDPSVKKFDNGGKVAQMSLATTKKARKLENGKEIPERTEWLNLVMSGGLADVAEKYIRKGSKIYVEGELRTREYEDRDGNKRYITEVYVQNLELLTPKEGGSTKPAEAAPAPEYEDMPF